MTPADETAVVLWLDLSSTDQMAEATIRAAAPPGAPILQLTHHGAERCVEGTPDPVQWPAVLNAIDRLVRRARQLTAGAERYRYWVTGRASLAAFFYLGHRLTKFSGAITVIYQPKLQSPVVYPLTPTEGTFFTFEHRSESGAPRDPVAVAISAPHPIADDDIKAALQQHRTVPSTIVHAHTTRRIEPATAGAAMEQLEHLVREIKASYGQRAYLAVFVWSSSLVALLAGLAINRRVCRNIRFFAYDGESYHQDYTLPYPTVPERGVVFYFLSDPDDYKRLRLPAEIRGVRFALSAGGLSDRLDIRDIPETRPGDIFPYVDRDGPGVLHFSGHGERDALVLEDDAKRSMWLSTKDLVNGLRLYRRTVRLVVLNACFSDSHEALLQHVDCVIAMHQTVVDQDAIGFAGELYRSLAQGDSVRDAFDKALHVMRLDRAGDSDRGQGRDFGSDGTELPPAGPSDPPRLLEHDPGCAAETYVVRRRQNV